ncbi:NEL-type E3 ubiquitin ligase domain-containing protein [Pseudomonas paralactis]|uniref:NEL-type E3 ubiquitin ligase domain-containing protein n=1 Tax=Pseudomonas paralactis TaxID=1615673 RepID=UPI00070E81CA|nr:NEL-type E3 ubiquitin ligase domain-containing protein [Pseudomonas paralactis]
MTASPPSAAPDADEQSVHFYTLQDNTPDWYTQSLAEHKRQLALQPLKIPDWYRYASEESRANLKNIHARSRRSLNQLDQLLVELKSPVDFAAPLLVAAIEKTFNLRLDVLRVFYARKMEELQCERMPTAVARSSAVVLDPVFYFYKGVSLLEAALGNFTEDEAKVPACKDCHLITEYNFHRRLPQARPIPGDVKTVRVRIEAHEFARMCRELDLGAKYYDHVRNTLNAQIRSTTPGASSGKLYSSMITAHRNQLALAAQIAVMKQDIQTDSHALIKNLLINQSELTLDGLEVKYSRFSLCACALEQILIIGPVVVKTYFRSTLILPARCLVYIPGDPEFVLKEYPNLDLFADHLTTRLCSAKYRAFFSQFVLLSQQDVFFTRLKAMLDPEGVFTPFDDFDLGSKRRLSSPADYGYAMAWKDVWYDSALHRIRSIISNSSTAAVSTHDIDAREHSARLAWWGNKALDILNVAAFVVPVLGDVMLAVAAVQMFNEFVEGAEAWSEGQTQEAWGHFSAVLLGAAGLAVPKALMLAKDSAFVKRLVRIEFADARVRLHDSDLGTFKHSVTLPADIKPDARGLYVHQGQAYLPVDAAHYRIMEGDGGTRLVHPDGASQYSPRIRHNGGGAWVHEFEQPLGWDRRTLLRRIGHTVDALSDTELEQLRIMSGVTDDELRRLYIDQQLPAPLFREGLRHFDIHLSYQTLLDNLSSTHPEEFGRVSGYQQLDLLQRDGAWPSTKVLEIRNAAGETIWRSTPDIAVQETVVLSEEEVLSGRILQPLLAQLDLAEARMLLKEGIPRDTVTLDTIVTGDVEVELPDHLQRPVSERALDVPSYAKRLAHYQRRLLKLAREQRDDLIERDLAAGNLSSDPNVQLVQRSFPGLPKLVIEELLQHATSAEMTYMEQSSRVPLRLAEEARSYLPRARLLRAHAALHFGTRLTMDSVRLALHKLAAIPGKLQGIGIELRADSSTGTLLDQVGERDALKRFRIIRLSMTRWEVRNALDETLYARSDKDAFYSALWFATGGEFGDWARLRAATDNLKRELVRQPLNEASARQALNVQPIKPGYKSPMRLADGRYGYPLSPVTGAAELPFICDLKVGRLYPTLETEEVRALLGMEGRSHADFLARLIELEKEFEGLHTTLTHWVQEGGANLSDSRRRVASRIKSAWRRISAQAHAADGSPIGHTLDISDENIQQLPAITANMDHVGSLNLSRMWLTDDSMVFLRAFGRLRWLKASGNYLTQLPEFANEGAGLTKLDLSANDLALTAQASARLERMGGLKILNLADNLRLGWTADISGLRSLNRLDLSNTETHTFPSGAEHLTQLAAIDLHSNQISTLPDYAFDNIERINLHDNPLSEETVARLGNRAPYVQPLWAHVTRAEGRELWLRDLEHTERTRCEPLWDSLGADPNSSAFFTIITDVTRSAEYQSVVTRPQLRERIWEMLTAVSEHESFRELMFDIADERFTCGDGSTLEFMNLERELFVLETTQLAEGPALENQLLVASKKLFRLKLVDDIAQRDVTARGVEFKEQSEVILAYRIRLADRLGLPVKTRRMLFPAIADVSQTAIEDAYVEVLRAEAIGSDEVDFLVGQEYWERYLRKHYAREFNSLTGPDMANIEEKSEALETLSQLQAEPDADADQATRDAWQANRDAVVERLGTLLGMTKDEILADGSMQSGFYDAQMRALGVARREQQNNGLRMLTRKVLDNHAAEPGV